MKRTIQDWQIKGSFTIGQWKLEVKEKNFWHTEAKSNNTLKLLKIAHSLTK